MSVFYEASYRVGAAQTGLYYQCRPSGVLGLLQETATTAACELDLAGPAMMERYHAIWMVVRIWYRLEKPLMWDDPVMIRTWHRADKGAALYRDFDIFRNGERIGEAVSTWVLAEADSRRLLRASRITEVEGTGGGALCKDKTLSKIKMPEDVALSGQRRFQYSDTDVNGHVNNVKYADIIADAVGLETLLEGRFVSSLQVGYLHECRAGETVDLYTGQEGESYYVHGADSSGQGRFDAALSLEKIP